MNNFLIFSLIVGVITIISFILIYTLIMYIIYVLSGYKKNGGHPFLNIVIPSENIKATGDYGEFLTYLKVWRFKFRGAKFLNNVYLFNENKSSEIDLIMIDKTGIYVFESKNIGGKILGKENDLQWTQIIGSQRNRFYNPIKQNKKHIEYIDNALQYKYHNYIYSFIVLSERCKRKLNVYNEIVVKRNNLVYKIKKKFNNSQNVLSKNDINNIYNILKKGINVTKEVKDNHIEKIIDKQNIYHSYIKKMDFTIGRKVYDMYQDMPSINDGYKNILYNVSFEDFKSQINYYIKHEKQVEPYIKSCTTRYIYYVNELPMGEIAIRTNKNINWKGEGNQIFFKIRKSQRNKGYGTKMLQLGLRECKKMNFKFVYLTCSKDNISAKRVITNNGGIIINKNENTTKYEISL